MVGMALDVRYALRSLRRSPVLSVVAVLTIALGVGANAAMFSILRGVLLRPLPYGEADRLVSLWKEKRWSTEMLRDVQERVHSFQGIAAAGITTYTLLDPGSIPEAVTVARVSTNYFDVLRIRPYLGRTLIAADATASQGSVVLLSHDYWQRRFGGDPSVIGRTIDLAGDGIDRRTVVGILPRGFVPPAGEPQAWVPLLTDPQLPGYSEAYGLSTIGRLRHGVTISQASGELRRQAAELSPMHPTQFREARYSPIDVVPLLDTIVGNVRPRLLVLMGVVGFILLIAASNVANLLLARSTARRRDVGVQMALGSSRWRVGRQVLAESTLLGLVGGAAGAGTALLALPLIRGYVAAQLPRIGSIRVDTTVLLFSLTVSLLAGIALGAAPALRASRQEPAGLLRESSRGSSQGRRTERLNASLVLMEVALSLVLLAGAGLMLKSLWQLTRVDPGFDAERVTTMEVTLPPGRYEKPEQREAFVRQLLARLQAVRGVESVGTINDLPLSGSSVGIPYRVEGEAVPQGGGYQVVNFRVVTPGYFRALRVPLLKGRMLHDQEPATADGGILVNQAFARQHWPHGEALGHRIQSVEGQPLGTIVGVVADVRQMEMGQPALPEMYVHASVMDWEIGALAIRTDGRTPTDALLSALREAEPNLGIRKVRSMEEVVRQNLGDSRFFARLFVGFAALALLLAAIGVYGVMAYVMSHRTREIGVRIALGATAGSVLRTMVGRAMMPILGGILLGTAGALAIGRVVASLLYEVSASDPWVLAGAAVLMASVGLTGAVIPIRRAARVDPVVALRGE
jgi:predicted permease